LVRNGAGGPGSTLLHIDRNVSTQFRYLRFDTPGTATFNVRSSGTGHIRLVNEGGNFAGPAHEDDPGSVIDWLPAERTQLVAFTATAAIHRVELAFATSSEVDAMELRLQRALAATGPWIDVVGSPLVPLGSPGAGANYALTDLLVVDTTKYFYRLREVLLHGEPRLLDDDFARPWPQQYGNSWYVGTNGGYPDIASAVTAASPGGNIIVQAGTYPAFTIDKPVRIFPDGSGPVHIDTTLGKLLVQNIPAGAVDLALYGLIVGSATSAFGMEVRNCDNVIVLDGLQVTTGTGVPGLRIDDATRVAVQSCAFVGDPRVYLSLGSVDELTVSALARVTYCNVTPGSLTVAPGAVASLRPGTMPGISFRPAWHGEKPVQMTVTAQPLSIYGVVYAPARDYLDLTLLFPIDMVLLVDQSQAVTLLVGLTPPSGSHAFQVIAPANALGWGTNLPLQILELRPDSTGRLGTSRDVVFLP
jgi:hypothetical protein